GIYDVKDKKISTYSNGMKQRLGIAQAIIHHPKLLLLDEPVASLDPLGKKDVLSFINDLKKEMTILYSTHSLTDVTEISDELLLLDKGRVIESGPLERLSGKYQITSSIKLEFHNDLEVYQIKINQLPSVETTYIKNNVMHVMTTNTSLSRVEILEAAVNENWSLTHFTIVETSLEDLFTKAVIPTSYSFIFMNIDTLYSRVFSTIYFLSFI